MDSGLYTLQRVAAIIGHFTASSELARFHLVRRLRREGGDVNAIQRVLVEYAETLGNSSGGDEAGDSGAGAGPNALDAARQREQLLACADALGRG